MVEAILDTPLFGLTMCISTYLLGVWIQKKTGWLLANPMVIAAAICISLLVPLDTAPYYAMLTDRTKGGAMGPMVTVDGLWTDDHQQVYDQQLDVIPGLFATGNCCGRRFGVQYSTPVAGVSIGIAWTLGRELGKYLAAL